MQSPHWRHHGFFNRPSELQPSRNSHMVGMQFVCPGYQALCCVIRGQQTIPTCIAHLFATSSPARILRRVRAIDIGIAIQGMFGARARPHVLEKSLKRVLPTDTDRNPTSTVIAIFTIFRIKASLSHTPPGPIFRTGRHTVRVAQGVWSARSFSLKTSATLDMPPPQVTPSNRRD